MPADIGKRRDTSAGSNVPTTHTPSRRSTPNRWQGPVNFAASGPFGLMRQMQDEMEQWFSRFGLSSPKNWMAHTPGVAGDWTPAVDAFQRGNEFVIRADLPGMHRTDVSVEVGDETVTIHGERKHEIEEDRDGVFWSERSYGSFSRVVPIPPGAIGESAKATFTNGVLEIVMPAPSSEARRGRKIDISGSRDERNTA